MKFEKILEYAIIGRSTKKSEENQFRNRHDIVNWKRSQLSRDLEELHNMKKAQKKETEE